MAKQTGLHQIRGKVGEHSYYRQSGVTSGLIRGINPGMSSRVKTSPEYANTRLNNKEFKTASRLAASMIDGILPRMRPMFNTFKNAKLSAGLLSIIKSKTGTWGERFVAFGDRDSACVAVNKLAKNNFSNYLDVDFGTYDPQQNVQSFDVKNASSLIDVLQSMGATGIAVRICNVQVYEGIPADVESGRLDNIVKIGTVREESFELEDLPFTSVMQVARQDVDLTILSGRACLSFYVAVLLPYRNVGNTEHVLQEGCTFAYFIDPEQEQ